MTIEEIRKQAFKVYKPPFKFDPVTGWVFDSDGKHVSDDGGAEGVILRVRGWGHLSKHENAEQLQDCIGEIIAEALNKYWNENNETNVSL